MARPPLHFARPPIVFARHTVAPFHTRCPALRQNGRAIDQIAILYATNDAVLHDRSTAILNASNISQLEARILLSAKSLGRFSGSVTITGFMTVSVTDLTAILKAVQI